MCDKKSADCYQQSAGVAGDSLCLGGFTMPTSIIPRNDGDFKSLFPPFPVGAGAVPGGVARRVRQAGPAPLSDGPLLVDNRYLSPPCGNTGVQSACVVDWLHGTFLEAGTSIDQALEHVRFLFGEIVPLDRGFRGYANSGRILNGMGWVAWDYNRPDMGVHVVLPSSALGELSRTVGDMQGLGAFLLSVGFKVGRFDVAIDDRVGYLDLDQICQAVDDRRYTSRWRRYQERRSRVGDGPFAVTLEFGSRTSESFLRIYDKAAEQSQKGVEGLDGVHWLRVELELKGSRAHAAFEKWVVEGFGFVPGLIRGYLEFKEPGQAEQRTRWSIAGWWARFLGYAEKLRLVLPSPVRTLETVRAWVERQVAPSLALLVKAEGGAVDWLYLLLKEGAARLTPAQLALLPGGA